MKKKHSQQKHNIGLDCNFTKTLVYRYDLADLLMCRCEKTTTCLKECHKIKPKTSYRHPFFGGTCFEELELFKRNGAVKKLPFKLQRHYGDLIEKQNNALITYSERMDQKRARAVTYSVALSVSQFRK